MEAQREHANSMQIVAWHKLTINYAGQMAQLGANRIGQHELPLTTEKAKKKSLVPVVNSLALWWPDKWDLACSQLMNFFLLEMNILQKNAK